ncbi:MAG: general secretion pathway protein GspA [Betaproteobacteria bacterium]|jgi:type II secretory pathway predicted ATPase ExeA|nr:MAG: general secretion pathway protein GspA [Betaproteobacteria bacterium]
MSKKLLALYSLKYNPFCQEIPASALFVSPAVESFCWRIENQVAEGGFALVTGEPGAGKSAVLRIIAERLGALRDLTVGVLTRPQASVNDFYRELGDLFGVPLTPSNRWGGAKALRQKWLAHIQASLYRPVLIVDEAQEMSSALLCELRLLSSAELDSRSILSVILCGDNRLVARFQEPELLPIASRIRSRLRIEPTGIEELRNCLGHLLKNAGNPRLISPPVMNALSEHAAGNYRTLMNMANDLLAAALRRELDQIDEKLFFEVFSMEPKTSARAKP